MFEIVCYDIKGNSINNLTQWDFNQTLYIKIYGCDETYLKYRPEVHFSNINSKEALVVQARVKEMTDNDVTISADVPNILLTEHYPLQVYIYLFENTDYQDDDICEHNYSQRVLLQTEIPIRKRVKPSDYFFVQNIERITADMIIDEAQQVIDSSVEKALDEVDDALDKIDAAREQLNTDINNAVDTAVQGLYDTVDETYVNEIDIVYDIDAYKENAVNGDGKVLSAYAGANICDTIEAESAYFGICDTESIVYTKMVTVDTDNLVLKNGTVLNVRFLHENTTDEPRLNINGTGNINVQASGVQGAYWQAHQVVTFVYDDQSDMVSEGATVEPVWQVASAPVYTNGNIIGVLDDKHIEITDKDVSDQIRFKKGDSIISYLNSEGLNLGENMKMFDYNHNQISADGIPIIIGNIDPNTVTEHCVYTYHDNMPFGGTYDGEARWMLLTYFANESKDYAFQMAMRRDKCSSSGNIAVLNKRGIYHRMYCPEEGQWHEWEECIVRDDTTFKTLIDNMHNPARLINSEYGKVNGVGGERMLRFVYDGNANAYYLRCNGITEIEGDDLSVAAASLPVHLGSQGYPYQNVHSKHLYIYEKKSDGSYDWITRFNTDGTANIGGNTTVSGELGVKGSAMIGGITTIHSRIQPNADNSVQLGTADLRFMNVYCKNSAMATSDLNAKRDLSFIDDRYIELFDLIQPYTYYFKNGDRVHTGFISQYVEEAMKQVGLTSEELAFFCKDIKMDIIYDEDGNIVDQKEVYDEDGNPAYVYALRYEEYIAIMAEKIKRMEKKHKEEIASIQSKVDNLESVIAEIQSKLS